MKRFFKKLLVRFPASEKGGDATVVNGLTDTGLVRDHNEDAYIVLHNEANLGNVDTVMAVADGMGGHAAGDVASSLVVGELVHLDGESHGADDALDILEHALEEANNRLADVMEVYPDSDGMGTTCIAMMRVGTKLAVANIGDSRAYLLRKGRLTRITKDHSFVQKLLDEGRIDVALCRSNFGRRPGDYHCHGHFPEPLWVVANLAHPLVKVEAPDFIALARQAWIVYPVSMPRMLEQEFVAAGLSQPVQSIEISSTYAILAMLERDDGVLALLPERIAREQVARGHVARVNYLFKTRNPAFELLWRRDRELSPAARRFIECYDNEGEGGVEICQVPD